MHDPTQLLTSQFLEWVAARPRCYADVMEAWITSCPRSPVWEAALEQGWVQVEHRLARRANEEMRGGADVDGAGAVGPGDGG